MENSMIVYSGESLKHHTEKMLEGIEKKRFIADDLKSYLTSPNNRKVCCLYGLRRTGKTTMMLQEIKDIGDYDKSLLIECDNGSSIMRLRKEIEAHPEAKYVFVDEITKARNFISASSVLANKYAAEGIKIVLSGTDSLGFFLAKSDELYDRADIIHTTYISFEEQHFLIGKGIADYIKYGGTLSPENVFYNRQKTDEYSNSSIVFNIVHSLEKWNQGRNYGVLRDIVDSGDLPSFINKVIEYDSREFLTKVINRGFESHDLGSLADLLTKSGAADPEVIYPSDESEQSVVLRKEMQDRIRIFLHIKDDMLEANPESVRTIIEYLTALDVLYKLPQMNSREEYLFTQAGMRYSQASDLSEALVTSDVFDEGYSDVEKKEILKKLEEDICGGILEDIVLYQTSRTLMNNDISSDYLVSKYRQNSVNKEFDVYMADYKSKTACAIEVKLSKDCNKHQIRHLEDEQFCKDFETKTGFAIKNKVVLYNGKTFLNPFGETNPEKQVLYLNVEDYLCHIKEYAGILIHGDKSQIAKENMASFDKGTNKVNIQR